MNKINVGERHEKGAYIFEKGAEEIMKEEVSFGRVHDTRIGKSSTAFIKTL